MLNRRFTNILIASYATPSGRRIINSFKPKISQIHEGANFARNRVIRHTTSISVTFLLGEIDVENVILRHITQFLTKYKHISLLENVILRHITRFLAKVAQYIFNNIYRRNMPFHRF